MTDDQLMQFLAHFGQQQQQPQGNPTAMFAEALKPQTARHIGIGGAEITSANPMGNAGGDPFTNGFFRNSGAQQQMGNSAGPFAIGSPSQGLWQQNPGGDQELMGVTPAPQQQTVLGGSPHLDAGQLALLHAHAAMGLPGPQAQAPGGDPIARAFWNKPTSLNPTTQANPYDNQMNQANFWNALAQQQVHPRPIVPRSFGFGMPRPAFAGF